MSAAAAEPLPPAITVTVACPICGTTLTVQPAIDADTGLYSFPADSTIADHETTAHPAPTGVTTP